MNQNFNKRFSLNERWNEASRIMKKYPDRIPIICERANTANRDCPLIDKNKYLVTKDLTLGQFIYIIRKRLRLSSEKAIFLFINGTIPPSSCMFTDIYDFHKDVDGFLYITYSFENTFG